MRETLRALKFDQSRVKNHLGNLTREKENFFLSLRPPLYGIPTIFQTDHKSVDGRNCWGGFFKWASLQTFNFLLCVSQRSWTILQPTISKKSQFMCLNHFQGWTVGTVCFLDRWPETKHKVCVLKPAAWHSLTLTSSWCFICILLYLASNLQYPDNISNRS